MSGGAFAFQAFANEAFYVSSLWVPDPVPSPGDDWQTLPPGQSPWNKVSQPTDIWTKVDPTPFKPEGWR